MTATRSHRSWTPTPPTPTTAAGRRALPAWPWPTPPAACQGVENAYTLELAGSHELCLLMASFEDSHPLVKQLWSVAQLYDTSFPPLRWIVPGVLPTGLGFVSGRPKIGKSYLVMQISGAVATGGVVFGRRVAQGRVFYLALEDTPRRLRDRLLQMGIPRGADISFATDWPPFSLGGAKDLLQEIGDGYSVVIVDTFSRAIGRADQMDATAMTLAMSQLHHIAAHEDVALLLVDHHRKSASMAMDSDPIDDIFGSTAKAGVVDVALGLYRKHGTPDATLKVTGRDVEEQELALHWDAEHFNWVYRGDAEEHERTQRRGRGASTACRASAGPPCATCPTSRARTGPTCTGGCRSWSRRGRSSARSRRGVSTTRSSTAHSRPWASRISTSPPATKTKMTQEGLFDYAD